MQFIVLIEFLIPGLATVLLCLALFPSAIAQNLRQVLAAEDTAIALVILAVSYPVGHLINFPEVSHSSWIRRLEKMNSVHPYHRPDAFWKRRHLVFAFHDTTFECVCDGFEVRSARGSIESVVPEMVKLLEWSAG